MKAPRDEHKYLITWEQRDFLLEYWAPNLIKDSFVNESGRTPVLSLYYDSPNLDFYNEKLDGVFVRSKIRLRVYDTDYREGGVAFLEIKQRFGDKIRKVRVMTKHFTQELFNIEKWDMPDLLSRDYFNSLIATYQPRPTAQVFYIREPFAAADGGDIRVTFDSSLIGMFTDEKLSSEVISDPLRSLMPENLAILEIKSNEMSLPPWIINGIRRAGLVQRPIPKYIAAIEKLGIQSQYSANGVWA
ncbi:MAG: polyphosphate polymerase domain-containing protein [Bdellovibrionales bacterium]|nr:polyphosphate polymerase domain-containing protein [Bdellovibrionales bacterium]